MMPAMKRILPLALAAALGASGAWAAEWNALRNDAAAKLSVDARSVKRQGDQVTLDYMVDYAKPQGDFYTQVRYLSVVTKATIRCKPRTLMLGMSELYSGRGATGVILATAYPKPEETRFAKVEAGTSDEDLWRHACERKAPAGKP
jgi:hypothetical protein